MSGSEAPPDMAKLEKGSQITLYVAGLTPEKDRVVIIVEVTGARQFKAKFLYDQEEVKALCMDLIAGGNAMEAAKPKGLIVLPPNGNTRLPGSLRGP